MSDRDSVMVVAGEVSGDIHAGNLLEALRELHGREIRAFGVGGDRLAEAGLERLATTAELAHMGLAEVVRELPRISGILRSLVTEAARRRPAVAVLVDSPDFNLRLARKLRRLGITVVLYVSPQLWAWRRRRVYTVRKLAAEVLCILPFEVDFYASHGVPASFVGHPLVDDLAREGILGQAVSPRPGRLALLPGSRAMEVRSLLPVMLAALERLPSSLVKEAVLVEAPGMGAAVEEVLRARGEPSRLRRVAGAGRRRELASAAAAWTASGTATLECALLDVPMAVGYRLHPLSYALARLLVRVPHVGLVNLIAEERAAPELLQGDLTPDRLASAAAELLGDAGAVQRVALRRVRERLGPPGASRRAAEAVRHYLG